MEERQSALPDAVDVFFADIANQSQLLAPVPEIAELEDDDSLEGTIQCRKKKYKGGRGAIRNFLAASKARRRRATNGNGYH